MMLSQKSAHFARKILKHNPLPTQPHIHQHDSSDACHHPNAQHPKPYLHVHDHRKQREIYQKPTSEKLDCMRTFKQQGNEHFKQKRYQQAAHYYHKVIVYADYTFPEKEKEQKEMEELTQMGNCNLGMSFVKMGKWREARDNFVQGAKGPSQKVIIKSLYWMIKCDIALGTFDKVQSNLTKLEGFGEKTINQVSELEIQLKKAIQWYEKKSKAVFGQMFSKQ